MADKIQKAYQASKHIYDDVLTQKTFLSRLYIKLFWNGTDDNMLAEKLLAFIPNDYAGAILDVPVGTGVFTAKKWATLTKSQITCLDYSRDMLEQAEARLKNCPHLNFIQGDVGKLPMKDENFDMVVSMNGFHAFPDKENAFKETWRVLKPGGIFLACFYIKGKSRRTDYIVKNILAKKGWFTPPFHTEKELTETLHKMYQTTELHIDGAMVYFRCVK